VKARRGPIKRERSEWETAKLMQAGIDAPERRKKRKKPKKAPKTGRSNKTLTEEERQIARLRDLVTMARQKDEARDTIYGSVDQHMSDDQRNMIIDGLALQIASGDPKPTRLYEMWEGRYGTPFPEELRIYYLYSSRYRPFIDEAVEKFQNGHMLQTAAGTVARQLEQTDKLLEIGMTPQLIERKTLRRLVDGEWVEEVYDVHHRPDLKGMNDVLKHQHHIRYGLYAKGFLENRSGGHVGSLEKPEGSASFEVPKSKPFKHPGQPGAGEVVEDEDNSVPEEVARKLIAQEGKHFAYESDDYIPATEHHGESADRRYRRQMKEWREAGKPLAGMTGPTRYVTEDGKVEVLKEEPGEELRNAKEPQPEAGR